MVAESRALVRPTGEKERSIGELFGDLASETGTLVRQEVKLATTELTQKASYAGRQSVYVIAGALLGVVSTLVLAAAIVIALDQVMPLWASALVVSAVFGLVAFLVARTGITALQTMNLRLDASAASLKEDKQWMTRQIS